MGKRGVKPKGKVKIKWSPNFAYAIGLIITDGCVSGDGRHVSFVSKDKEQIFHFMEALNIKAKIGIHTSGYNGANAYRCQFGDVLFHKFLCSIGIMPAKSKILKEIKIPSKYFFDFLRGCFDGDGCFYSYWDPRWKSSFMFYTEFCSASQNFIKWLQMKISKLSKIKGHITTAGRKHTMWQIKYAKKESFVFLKENKDRGLKSPSGRRNGVHSFEYFQGSPGGGLNEKCVVPPILGRRLFF